MLRKTCFSFSVLICFIFLFTEDGSAQPTWTIDPFGKEKKPEQYEEKKLGSERTADKKFTTFRRVIQNNVTHYNFYFNANNKLNAVIERAKLAQVDDYSKLLSFFPYSFENTASQKIELDSVIYKSTAGILLHDLRSDWVDNLYLLIGKAYYLRNELDSAALTFQFINYNLFPRKKNEDDGRIVGANESATNSMISIANKEDRNILQKAMSKPPSRNDALIWLTRTLTDRQEFGDAAGLINILTHDPNLPSRLRNDLEEVTAYWYYAQNNFDSSAVHLEKALSKAEKNQDRARSEYLLAQMYEMSGQFDKASHFYAKASKHTVDPVMDIYAQLNDAKMFRQNGNTKELQNSIARLLKMAKKDKYEAYRDIIYYSTGQLSLQHPDTTSGIGFFSKSLQYNENNPLYKSKAFLQLANLAYDQRDYRNAFAYYDSLKNADTAMLDELSFNLLERRNSLEKVVKHVDAIDREDSLQRIAAMSPEDRDAFLIKMLRKYRKEIGLKDDNSLVPTATFISNKSGQDLFQMSNESKKGEWYFYNNGLKTRGFNEFKSKWGQRLNVDNWRRRSVSDAMVNRNSGGIDPNMPIDSSGLMQGTVSIDLTYGALAYNIPLTPGKMDTSNAKIATSLLALGKLFQFELQDHEEAIATYEQYLNRFPSKPADEAYLGLYYSYNKLGNTAKANYYKDLLTNKYPESAASNLLLNPASAQPNKKNPEVTKRYEAIYDMFIEGKFDEAVNLKRREDSTYGQTYWTPQLLYIEAIQNIKIKNDSAAIRVLNNIISLYPESPLKPKAETMISVLGRRAEIESYLTKLEVTRAEENTLLLTNEQPKAAVIKTQEKPEVKTIAPVNIPSKPVVTDTIARTLPGMSDNVFTLTPDKPHSIIMILDKVDGVYVNEAKNAFTRYNREKFSSQPITITRDQLDGDKALLVFNQFADAAAAVTYFEKIKKAAPAEISWLQPSKYSFLIITDANLQILKTNKNISAYRTLLNGQYNNRF